MVRTQFTVEGKCEKKSKCDKEGDKEGKMEVIDVINVGNEVRGEDEVDDEPNESNHGSNGM